MQTIVAQGEAIPSERLGSFEDHSTLLGDADALQAELAGRGYLYMREFIPRDDVMAARTDIFGRLAEVGEIVPPVVDGIYSGSSRRKEQLDDLGAFWKSVCETWSLRRITHGPRLYGLMSAVFGEPARAQDYLFLRPANRGKFTNLHCDYGFFTRTTETVLTAWIALGDVPISDGPLFVVEGSHRFEDIVASQKGFDVARDTHRTAAFDMTPLQLAEARDTRLLTRDFAAGDMVIFPMFTLHGSLQNVSEHNRVRLSVDVRYQRLSDAVDERYFGPSPTGTTGIGYGELVGAKPLTEAWHIR